MADALPREEVTEPPVAPAAVVGAGTATQAVPDKHAADEPAAAPARPRAAEEASLASQSASPAAVSAVSADAASSALAVSAVKKSSTSSSLRMANQIPADIDEDPAINAAMAALPSNYNFEIKKTIWKVRTAGAKCVALQFPEGLLLFACTISDIITRFTGADTLIMGDVTYGACCIDDLGAAALGADFLVHYGHSCLVPIDVTHPSVRVLYVFVDVAFDTSHLARIITEHFPPTSRLAVLGTIQFAAALYDIKTSLGDRFAKMLVPQARPLSPGEVLGCTSPSLAACGELDAFIFVADGRFHLESVMIHNPSVPAYRYDPYGKRMTREYYDTETMHAMRKAAIAQASTASRFGVILGTLGRQGNPAILSRLEAKLQAAGKEYFVLLVSEITPQRLAQFKNVEAWIQIACPRLSIDWGTGFWSAPLLTPYEAEVALGTTAWRDVYPMDYYARGSGTWTNYYSDKARPAGTRVTESKA